MALQLWDNSRTLVNPGKQQGMLSKAEFRKHSAMAGPRLMSDRD